MTPHLLSDCKQDSKDSYPKLLIVLLASMSLVNAAERTTYGQAVVRVPQDKPSIQSAIDSTSNGDTVSISPGLYSEQINFHGKAITVEGNGAGVIIDAGLKGAVVTFNSGERARRGALFFVT